MPVQSVNVVYILFKVLFKLGSELCQTIFNGILRVENAVKSAVYRQLTARSCRLVCAFQPCGKFCQMSGVCNMLK